MKTRGAHFAKILIPLIIVLAFLVYLNAGKKKEVRDLRPELPQIEGWKLGELKTYVGDELYGPIDGEADRFLHYGFREAYFTSYEQINGDGIIDVQIYEMGSGLSAYGIFTMYDSRELSHLFVDDGQVYPVSAWSDSILFQRWWSLFARISLHNMEPDEALLRQVGEALIESIKRPSDGAKVDFGIPGVQSYLPENYIRGTLKYFRKWETYREINYDIHENVLGLSGSTDGFQAAYTLTETGVEKDFFLMIQYRDEKKAKETFRELVKFYKQGGYEVTGLGDGPISIHRNGKLFARYRRYESFVYGVFDVTTEEKAEELLGQQSLDEAITE